MKLHSVTEMPARVIGIAVQRQEHSDSDIEHSLDELSELLKTLGAEMVATMTQKRTSFSRSCYLGRGKIQELKDLAETLEADYVVADDELSALQIKSLEAQTELRVKDRTSVILDIFASHATTREGKLQIELAMHQYQLPRLLRMWPHLERQRGGIGLKGPGETQLETDRRLLNVKIKKLKEELEKVSQIRDTQGKQRFERFAPLFSLVGYTNSGKSTIINCLSGSDVKMSDGLFTTLDPTSRKVELPGGSWCIVSDTVGFIRKLPHGLVEAFKATLENVVQSEVLILVADVSDPQFREHLEAVDLVLSQIGANEHEKIYVFNKIDKGIAADVELLKSTYPGCILISAKYNTNIDELKNSIEEVMRRNRKIVNIRLPANSKLIGEAMKVGKIIKQEWEEGFVNLQAELPQRWLDMVQKELDVYIT